MAELLTGLQWIYWCFSLTQASQQKEAREAVSFQRDIPLNKKGCGETVMLPASLPPHGVKEAEGTRLLFQ